MGTIDIVIILLFLVADAAAIVGLIAVIGNRWKVQGRRDEVHKVIAEKTICEEEQVAIPVFEEEGPQDEMESPQQAEELVIEVDALGEIEKERQQFEGEEHNEEHRARGKTNGLYRKPKELQEVKEEIRNREKPQPVAQEEVRQIGKTVEKRPAPVERGGRPRTTTKEPAKQTTQENKPRRLKPEMVCWKKDRQWVIGVEVPEEFLNHPDLAVLQNGSALERDEFRETCWPLERASGYVVVRWGEGEDYQDIEIDYGQKDNLLFKLSGQNQNEGRRVISPSLGWHLVITPEDWDRDEALSGPPLIAPELVAFQGYLAHFFISEKGEDTKIAFLTPMGESVIVESKASKFELIGACLNDTTQNIGLLFGQRPPKIRGSVHEVWKDVGTIVVGEEGGGKRRWRKEFYPDSENKEEDLPPEIVKRKIGWYFLRFYDTNDDLIESLDFRVMIALQDIKILQSSHFPSDDGHESAHIELNHESNCTIQPADGIAKEVQIEKKDNRTILTIPPAPIYDETRWLVGSGSTRLVQATFLVERIWWAVDKEEFSPSFNILWLSIQIET